MPAGYGLLDPSEGVGLLPWTTVAQALTESRNYWLATTRPDGRPHCVPVWGVWADGALYFGSDPRSRKGRNLQADPRVCVHLESGDDVVIVEGVVQEVSGDELASPSRAYAAKYELPGGLGSAALMVRPHVAFAWREKDFPGSATRWRFTPS